MCEWTAGEIAKSYKQAGCTQTQISVLAQLNDCSTRDIEQILREQGFEIKVKEERIMGRPKKEDSEPKERIEAVQKPKSAAVGTKVEIPEAVKRAITERMIVLTESIDELELEMRQLQEFLRNGK